ncbi:MAG: NADH-quinone oxidoreductase subunit A [Planctomycetales bacterium]|nr:NADH-quinone oxidoreductase subunit A [Planctomycetales bacterium]
MFETYFGLLVLLTLSAGLAAALLAVSAVLGPRRHESATLDPYECGVPSAGDLRRRTSVRYYVTAVLFILFDLEVAFLWAWAVVFHESPLENLAAMGVFIGVLGVGYAYAWAKGAFEWD